MANTENKNTENKATENKATENKATKNRIIEEIGPQTWPLWEVFIRSARGLSHVHAGSLHAPDATMAVRNARDLYTRRNEGVSVWVVPSAQVRASDPDARGAFFESALTKDYRHASYYTASEGVKHL